MEKRHYVLIITCLIYSLIFTYFGKIIINQPYIGVELNKKEGVLFVEKIYANSWGEQYLKKGDIIVTKHYKGLDNLEGMKNLTIYRGKEILNFKVSYHKLPDQILFQIVIPFIFLFICLTFSIILLLRGKWNKPKMYTICFFLVVSLGYLSASGSSREDFISRFISGLCLSIVPYLLVHLLYQYFKKSDIKALTTVSLYLAYTLCLFIGILEFFPLTSSFKNYISSIQLFIFGIGTFYLITIIFSYYNKLKSLKDGPIIRIILISLMVSFLPIILFYILPIVIFHHTLLSAEIAISSMMVLPFSLFYLNFKSVYFDVDFLIQRIKYYSLASILFVLIILLFSINVKNNFTSLFLFGLLLLVCFNILLFFYGNLQLIFNKNSKFNYQDSLYNFTRKSKKILSFQDLIYFIEKEVKVGLRIPQIVPFKLSKENGTCTDLTLDCKYINILYNNVLDLEKNKKLFDKVIDVHNELYLVLGEENNEFVVLYIDRSHTKVKLNIQEKKWLNTLMYYANIIFENLKKVDALLLEIENLKRDKTYYPYWMAQLFCRISEKERANLANDIHDNILQDQLLLYRKFEEIANDKNLVSNLTQSDITFFREMILDNIYLIRETCNHLKPAFLKELGIVEALKNLIDKIQLHSNFEIEYYFDELECLDDETSINLYRIIQELLNNAIKHSEATKVIITLQRQEPMVCLNYRDNGIGFNNENKNKVNKTIGLSSIKERAHALKGSVTFTSTPKKGLQVSVSFSLDNLPEIGVTV
ncbi:MULTISPECIES: sensor histidine kinase [Priestia]|uniref:sensor histidine kinase n=1 Tax=Priestia TaxID=2800373 RepID=UPI001FD831D7|nr:MULTISPECIES: sensor histidine kinase [Priestia]USL45322.1 hypothetical protein LIS78_28345 [Priestia megaterium]